MRAGSRVSRRVGRQRCIPRRLRPRAKPGRTRGGCNHLRRPLVELLKDHQQEVLLVGVALELLEHLARPLGDLLQRFWGRVATRESKTKAAARSVVCRWQ